MKKITIKRRVTPTIRPMITPIADTNRIPARYKASIDNGTEGD